MKKKNKKKINKKNKKTNERKKSYIKGKSIKNDRLKRGYISKSIHSNVKEIIHENYRRKKSLLGRCVPSLINSA